MGERPSQPRYAQVAQAGPLPKVQEPRKLLRLVQRKKPAPSQASPQPPPPPPSTPVEEPMNSHPSLSTCHWQAQSKLQPVQDQNTKAGPLSGSAPLEISSTPICDQLFQPPLPCNTSAPEQPAEVVACRNTLAALELTASWWSTYTASFEPKISLDNVAVSQPKSKSSADNTTMSGQRGGTHRTGVPSRDYFGDGPVQLASQVIAAANQYNNNRLSHRPYNPRLLNRRRRRFDPNSAYPPPLTHEYPHEVYNQGRRGLNPNCSFPTPLPRERPHGAPPIPSSSDLHTHAPREGSGILRYPTPAGDFVPSSSRSPTPSGDPGTDREERAGSATGSYDVRRSKSAEALVEYQDWLVKRLEQTATGIKDEKRDTSVSAATEETTAITDQAFAAVDQTPAVSEKPSPLAKVTTPPGFPSRTKELEQQKKRNLETEPELEHESESEEDEPEPKEQEVRPTALASFYPLHISSGANIWAFDPVNDRQVTDWPTVGELQDAGVERALRGRERMLPIPRYRHLDARSVFATTGLEEAFQPGPIVAAAAAVVPPTSAHVPRSFRQYAIDLIGDSRYPIPCDHQGA